MKNLLAKIKCPYCHIEFTHEFKQLIPEICYCDTEDNGCGNPFLLGIKNINIDYVASKINKH